MYDGVPVGRCRLLSFATGAKGTGREIGRRGGGKGARRGDVGAGEGEREKERERERDVY